MERIRTRGGVVCAPCAGYRGHPLRTRDFEKPETKEKRGGNVKRYRACFLGRMPSCRAHVLAVLSVRCSTRKERVSRRLSTFLTNVPGRHLGEGWRLVLPQISPHQLCYLFHILQIDSPDRQVSSPLSPIFSLFLEPSGKWSHKLQDPLAEEEQAQRSTPPLLQHWRSRPRNPA